MKLYRVFNKIEGKYTRYKIYHKIDAVLRQIPGNDVDNHEIHEFDLVLKKVIQPTKDLWDRANSGGSFKGIKYD